MRNVKLNKIKEIMENRNANLTPVRRAPQAPPLHSAYPQSSPNMLSNNIGGAQGYRPNIPYR